MSNTARLLTFGALAVFGLAGGCAKSIDPKLFYGTYEVSVSAFGKSDPTVLIASAGSDETVLFNFTQGFSTEYNEANATGLRVSIDGTDLIVDKQPIHVEHSSGELDGTVTGQGTTGGSSIDLTLKVLPTNVAIIGPDGQPLPAGTTVDYVIKGTK